MNGRKVAMCFLLMGLLVSCSSGQAEPSSNPDAFHEVKITFPANELEKTEFNSYIYDIEPFQVSVKLPDGWELAHDEEKGEQPGRNAFLHGGTWSNIQIFSGEGECVGAVGYNLIDSEMTSYLETKPSAIYGQVSMGNGYHFDVGDSYQPLTEDESVALTGVFYSQSFLADYDDAQEEIINKGILAYDKDLLTYVAFEFRADSLDEQQWTQIAESISFSPSNGRRYKQNLMARGRTEQQEQKNRGPSVWDGPLVLLF